MRVIIIFLIILTLAGCRSSHPGNEQNGIDVPAPPNLFSPEPLLTPVQKMPPQEEISPLPPLNQTTTVPDLQNLIGMAKADLSQRLPIPLAQINSLEFTEVEWSDSSLDCPQPGMDYLQVITPGYRIILETAGNVYEYHSNRDAYVVYCENINAPSAPTKP